MKIKYFNKLFLVKLILLSLFSLNLYSFNNDNEEDLSKIQKAHNFLKEHEEKISYAGISSMVVVVASWATFDIMKHRLLDLIWDDRMYNDNVDLFFKKAKNTSNSSYKQVRVFYDKYDYSNASAKYSSKDIVIHGSKAVNSHNVMQLAKVTRIVALSVTVVLGVGLGTKYLLDIIYEDENGVLTIKEIDSLKKERFNRFLAYDWELIDNIKDAPFSLLEEYYYNDELKEYIEALASIES